MALTVEEVVLATDQVNAIVARKLPGGSQQTLVCTERGIYTLAGLDDRPHGAPPAAPEVRLGQPLQLFERAADGRIQPYTWSPGGGDASSRTPLYAMYSPPGPAPGDSGCCYFSTRDTIMRLDALGVAELVAGQHGSPGRRDGPPGVGLVQGAVVMGIDGAGGLLFADGNRNCVRHAFAAAPAPAAFTVTTLALQVPDWSLIHALAYDHTQHALYVCTPRAVYKAPGLAAGPAAPPASLQLVAGNEDAGGFADGAGRAALFGSICDAVVDSRGRVYVTDMEGPDGAVVRLLDPAAGYAVRTLPLRLGQLDRAARLAVLPGGLLAVYEWGGSKVWLAQLGVEESRPTAAVVAATAASPAAAAAASSSGPDLAGLSEDMRTLMADPWGTADVTIAVGCASFHAHSQVLVARSEFFRRQLLPPGGGGGGDGGGGCTSGGGSGRREVSLPDADPAAFSPVLNFIYTGGVDVHTPLLRPALVLANRLMLPRLAARLQQQLQLQPQPQTGAVAPTPATAGPPGQQFYPQIQAYASLSSADLAAAPPSGQPESYPSAPPPPPPAGPGTYPWASPPPGQPNPDPSAARPSAQPGTCASAPPSAGPGSYPPAPPLAQPGAVTSAPPPSAQPSSYSSVPPPSAQSGVYPSPLPSTGPGSYPSAPSLSAPPYGPPSAPPTAPAQPFQQPTGGGSVPAPAPASAAAVPPAAGQAPQNQPQTSYPQYSGYPQRQEYNPSAASSPYPTSYSAQPPSYATSSQPAYGAPPQTSSYGSASSYGQPAPAGYGPPQPAAQYGQPPGAATYPTAYSAAYHPPYGAPPPPYPGQGYPPQAYSMPPQSGSYYQR